MSDDINEQAARFAMETFERQSYLLSLIESAQDGTENEADEEG